MTVLTSLAATMPGMPPESWWMAPAILLLLGIAAITDGYKGRVPDVIIVPGLFGVTALQGLFVDWAFAGKQLAFAFGAAIALYAINQGWYRLRKRDALGMGDAKWTALAVAGFGLAPALIAWLLGAWLALGWIGMARLAKKPVQRVHFAPFLFLGLLTGIYWLRLN